MVCLLSCTGKLLEHFINRRILWHLESNSLLTLTQTGYRQHRSTEDQEKKKVLAVFFDLSKAFDTVWKEGLLLKLLRNGVCEKMYNWPHNFLFQRTARVKLDGTLSNLVKMREGVLQDGIISPTLFIVYCLYKRPSDCLINSHFELFVHHLYKRPTNCFTKSHFEHLHADNLAVWCLESSTATATYRMQNTIKNVSEWTSKWALNIIIIPHLYSALFLRNTFKGALH